MAESETQRRAQFPTTDWPRVKEAAAPVAEGGEALGELLAAYRRPLLNYLRRKFGLNETDAEDALHGFIERQIMEQGLLADARRDRGKFRSFLCTTLSNYWSSELRARGAKSRTPEGGFVPLAAGEGADALGDYGPPESAYDVDWAKEVLERTLGRVRAECKAEGRRDLWEVLLTRDLGPLLFGWPEASYAALIQRRRYRSPAEAYNARTTGLRRFRRTLVVMVAKYEPWSTAPQEGADEVLQILVRTAAWKDSSPFLAELEAQAPALDTPGAPSASAPDRLPALGAPWHPEEYSDVLRHQLAAPWGTAGEMVPASTTAAEPATLGDLLRHPQPPLDPLHAARDFARDNCDRRDSHLPSEVARFLYYLTIAVAWVRRGEWISRLPQADLRAAFQWAADQPWAEEDLKPPLREALMALAPPS